MPTLVDTFLDMASDITETQPFAGGAGYKNIVSANRYSLNQLLPSDAALSSHLGHTLRETLYPEVIDNGEFHGGAGFTTQSQGTTTGFKLTSEMAYHYNHIEYNESEIEAGLDPRMNGDFIKVAFQKTMGGKLQNLAQANTQSIENAMWAPANQTTMFTNPTRPVSIPALITEADSGGYALQADTTPLTQVYNASLTDIPTFKNGAYEYAALGGNTTDGEDLLGELEQAWMLSSYEPIPIGGHEYGPGNEAKQVMFTSHWGIRVLMAALRSGQTQWGTHEYLSGGSVRIGPMLFKAVNALDTALLYDGGGSALVNEASATKNGPRFYGVDTSCTKLLMEEGHFMRMEDPVKMTVAGKPYEIHQGCKSKLQLWCTDRRRNFIVSPSAAAIS